MNDGLITHDNTHFSVEFSNKLLQHLDILLNRYPMAANELKWVGSIQRRNEIYTESMTKLAMDQLIEIIDQMHLEANEEEMKSKEQEFRDHFAAECAVNDKAIAVCAISDRMGSLKGIAIHERWANNYDGLTEIMTKQAQCGGHPRGTEEGISIVTHEFGHLLYSMLKKQGIAMLRIDLLWERCNRDAASLGDNSEWYWVHNLSGQAALSIDEFVAEGFAEYIHNPCCRPLAKAIGQAIDRALTGYVP